VIRRAVAASLLAVAACLLGGCVIIQSTAWEQQEIVGDMRVTVTVCASGNSAVHPGCPITGNSGQFAGSGSVQLLLAVRLPSGVEGLPGTLAAVPAPAPPATGEVVLRPSPTYEAALQAAVPAPVGSRWVGYMSDPYTYAAGASGTAAQAAALSFDLRLPRTADGSPFFGPLPIQPVVGVRFAGSGDQPQRPVECGESPYSFDSGTVCIDSPAQIVIDSPIQIPTRDFGIVAGSATASPGQTVQIPFGVRGAGALPDGLTASLAAATTVPAATAAPSQGSAPLANGSDTRITVAVAIPRDAGPGVHDVTLTGWLDNGQARVGTARLTVRDRQPPKLTALRVKPRQLRPATRRKPRRGANVSFQLSEPAQVAGTVQRCARFAKVRRGGRTRRTNRCVRYRTLRGRIAHTGVLGANRLRFNGRLRGRALKRGSYRLTLLATDAAGNRGGPVRTTFKVRR